ncbi:MAG: hypothetical protein HQK50_13550 [Oligoflexia bacterium]|nr:hypothetical protein [Oligoflexia bacterium]
MNRKEQYAKVKDKSFIPIPVSKYFVPIWKIALNKTLGLSPLSMQVLLYVAERLHEGPQTSTAELTYKSLVDLAECLEMSPKSLKKALKELQEAEILSYEKIADTNRIKLTLYGLRPDKINSLSSDGFLKFPKAVASQEMGLSALAQYIYTFLLVFGDIFGVGMPFQIAYRLIHQKLGLSANTAKKALDELVSAKLIQLRHNYNATTKKTITHVFLQDVDAIQNSPLVLNHNFDTIPVTPIQITPVATITKGNANTTGKSVIVRENKELIGTQQNNEKQESWETQRAISGELPVKLNNSSQNSANFDNIVRGNNINNNYNLNHHSPTPGSKHTYCETNYTARAIKVLKEHLPKMTDDVLLDKYKLALDDVVKNGAITASGTIKPCIFPAAYLASNRPEYGTPTVIKILERAEKKDIVKIDTETTKPAIRREYMAVTICHAKYDDFTAYFNDLNASEKMFLKDRQNAMVWLQKSEYELNSSIAFFNGKLNQPKRSVIY